MASKPKRSTRFDIVKQMFGMLKGQYTDVNAVKAQFEYGNIVIFASEIDKFIEANPDIPRDEFEQFLKDTGAYKKAGSKAGSGGGNRQTSLLDDAKITELQIAPEDVETYKSAITVMQEQRKVVNGLIKNPAYTCGMYITKSGKKQSEPAQ